MLLDLSVELLQQIASELNKADQERIRIVGSRYLAYAMEPLLFSSIVLKTHALCQDDNLRVLEALTVTGEAGWAPCVRTLVIRRSIREEDIQLEDSDAAMEDLLVRAFASLVNVRTVIWDVYQLDPVWHRRAISRFSTTRPCLEDLQLEVRGNVDLQLMGLPPLRKLKIGTLYLRPARMADDICQVIARSHSLTYLHLVGSHHWAKIWTMLGTSPELGIHPKHLHTDVVTPDLLTYLASYSGLESLSLQNHDNGINARDNSDQLADIFFTTVLPNHTQTLVELSCPVGFPSRWSFGPHNVENILALQRLKGLDMSLRGFTGEEDATLLLQSVPLLPALRNLVISSAVPQLYFPPRPEVIKGAIENFRSQVASPAIVFAAHTFYELAVLSEFQDQQMLAYREIENPESPGFSALMAYRLNRR
ncbi:F-box domain-containing protein [Mycena venus]|uniref:F-box domain-containing protein n=1 Tax=Mycena venus TaxID=2733690 RepID=A0A8H6XPS9_9AGAR|nr:F-box domain-containing protein [Mycena venus]